MLLPIALTLAAAKFAIGILFSKAMLIGLVLAVAMWPYLADFIARHVLSVIETRVSRTVAMILRNILSFIEEPVIALRRVVKDGFSFVKQRVLGLFFGFSKTGANKVNLTTTTYVQVDADRVAQVTSEQEVTRDKIPAEMRQAFASGQTEATLDAKLAMEEKVKQKLPELA